MDFEIQPGEAVGIVGVNGAGKSTLLKMITGTTQPTCGNIQLQGRVAALLGLGMGFHPYFTGRQNAFLAGQLLGMLEHVTLTFGLVAGDEAVPRRPIEDICADAVETFLARYGT